MKQTFLLLILALFFNSNVVYAQKEVAIEIEIKPTKANRKAWDMFGGAPDILLEIHHPDLSVPLQSQVFRNVFEASYSFDFKEIIGLEGFLQILIADIDIAEHDLIGKCRISYSEIVKGVVTQRNWTRN